MKKTSKTLFLILAFTVLISSCGNPRQIAIAEMKQGKSSVSSSFVIKTNGDTVFISKMKRPQTKPANVIGDGITYQGGTDINYFQSENGFFAWHQWENKTKPGRGTYISSFYRGKINLYDDAIDPVSSFFYFEKVFGKIQIATFKDLSDAVSDQPAVLAELQKTFKKEKVPNSNTSKEKLIHIASMYTAGSGS